MTLCYSFHNSLIFKAIELAVELHVIPLISGQHVVLHGGKSIEKVGTQAWVNVVGHVDGGGWPVLRPVCEVA